MQHLGMRLELAGQAAQDAVAHIVELFLRDGAGAADVGELFEGFADCVGGNGGLHGAARRKRGGVRLPVYVGHVAVTVALVLAQVHVEARGELPAEYVVEQGEREVVGVMAGDGEMASPDDGLRRAGLIGEVYRGFGGGGRAVVGLRGGGGGMPPSAEYGFRLFDGLDAANIAYQN